jgi:molybdopterin/thiamine biosynthesis adenylyltransferase
MTEMRPKLKHTSPVFVADGTLFIGGFGEVTEVSDSDGAIRRLLELLDGTRTIEEVHRDLRESHPSVSVEDVRDGVAALDGKRFLEDASLSPAGLLDEYDLSRWERNINFFGSVVDLATSKYELQHRLKTAKVAVLGLGGLGSHLMFDLPALGIGDVRVVEFDRVELSNLNRQILYEEADVGRLKVEVAMARVPRFSSRIHLEAIPRKIESTQDVIDAVSDRDVVISVADRPKMEIMNWVNEGCVMTGVPLITGGLETQRALYYSMIPGVSGCVECWRIGVSRTDPVSFALLEEKRRLQIGGDNAAFVPFVTAATGFLLAELVRMLTGIAPPAALGRLMEFRFRDFAVTEAERWKRDPDCPICRNVTARDRSPEPAAAL